MRNPEFQLVVWTLKFYMQLESRTSLSEKVAGAKERRTVGRNSLGPAPRKG